MARVNYVKKARASKTKRICAIGQEEILPGEAYKYVDLKTGPVSGFTRFFCYRHNPRASHLTANDRMSSLYASAEAMEDAVAAYQRGEISIDDLKSEVESQADEIEGVADEYEESASNMEEYFQGSSQVDEIREKGDSVREWAESLRNLNWPDEDESCTNCGDVKEVPQHDESNEKEFDHEYEKEELDIGEIESAINEFPL